MKNFTIYANLYTKSPRHPLRLLFFALFLKKSIKEIPKFLSKPPKFLYFHHGQAESIKSQEVTSNFFNSFVTPS